MAPVVSPRCPAPRTPDERPPRGSSACCGSASSRSRSWAALLGVGILWLHLTSDPLVDFHAYYEAAARLNAGEPLYQPDGDPNLPHFYFYPPLLAILLRPLALLPYDTAVLIWGAIVVAAFVATLFQLGVRRQRTWLALGILGGPDRVRPDPSARPRSS